jgi:hypothetical protein
LNGLNPKRAGIIVDTTGEAAYSVAISRPNWSSSPKTQVLLNIEKKQEVVVVHGFSKADIAFVEHGCPTFAARRAGGLATDGLR